MITSSEQSFWDRYSSSDEVREIISVLCTGGSDAILKLYKKVDGVWNLQLQTPAFIGRNGIGKRREGDMKTPAGDFGILTAFGICRNPGTALPYLDVDETLYCCDEPGENYNRLVHVRCGGEHLCEYVPQYHFGLFLDYNKDGVYPLGSAIFIHCQGDKPYTAGCVAIPEKEMERLLRLLEPGARVVISSCAQPG